MEEKRAAEIQNTSENKNKGSLDEKTARFE